MNAITQTSLTGLHLPAVSFCGICHRTLTNPASIAAGIGPVCAGKHKDDAMHDQDGDRYDLPWDPATMDVVCRRDPDGTRHFNVAQRHHHHSPTGMEWGYAGSGPADFALNILSLFLPTKAGARSWDEAWPWNGPQKVKLWDGTFVSGEARTLHQSFKFAFVVALPREGGVIRGDDVRAWIAVQLRRGGAA